MQQMPPGGISFAVAGQGNADHQGREFEQDKKNDHVAFGWLIDAGQKSAGHGKGDDTDRAVMGGDGGGIGPRQSAEAAQNGEGGEWNQGGNRHHPKGRANKFVERIARQFNAALETDGEQQKNTDRLVENAGDFQI